MIILSNITDRLYVVLSGAITTNQLQCITSWRDRTSTTFTADRTLVNTNNTTDVSIAGSPTVSTQRLIDLVNIYNKDTVTATVNIKFDANGTQTILKTFTLLTGESVEFIEGGMWTVYTSLGIVKATQNAAGSDTQIQYNSSGVLAGNNNLTYNPTTNSLSLLGTDADLIFNGITTEPSPPSAGNLTIYSKSINGRMLPKWKGPSGLDTPFQPAFFGNNIVFWQPGATSGVLNGSVGTAIAAGVSVLPTTTNQYTAMRRSTFTAATGVNLQNSYRTDAMFFRGATSGQGGFFAFFRFGFNVWTATNRLFVGLCVDTTTIVTTDPSLKLNLVGFGVDTADNAITFMHNDGTLIATKDTIAGQPALATNNGYDAYIFCKTNDNTVYWRLDNILTQTTIASGSATSDLPVNTTMLNASVAIGNGATNLGASAAIIGLNRIYIESDY